MAESQLSQEWRGGVVGLSREGLGAVRPGCEWQSALRPSCEGQDAVGGGDNILKQRDGGGGCRGGEAVVGALQVAAQVAHLPAAAILRL